MRQRVSRIAAIFVCVLVASALLGARASETVCVTRTGATYHRAGCGSLRSRAIPMSLAATPVHVWSAAASQKGKSSGSGKTVHVKGYKKKDGTAVKAHTRKATKAKKASGAPTHAGSSSTATPHVSHASRRRCESCDRDEHGKIVRSQDARKVFKKATGFPKGRPGFVIDHIVPLACGGQDLPSNMQWQTRAEARAKDKVERTACGR